MKKVFLPLVIALVLLFNPGSRSYGQIAGTGVFLQGRYLEIGMVDNGALGATGTPLNYHPHNSGTTFTPGLPLAEVYDYGHDGWAVGSPAFNGDYTYPGLPFEGWELQVGSGRNQATPPSGYAAGGGGIGLTGGISGYTSIGGDKTAIWTGSALSGQLQIRMNTMVDTNASWVIMQVKMYNTGTSPLSGVYYLRTADADMDQTWGGTYNSRNAVQHQNDASHRVMVGSMGYTTPAYMGIGATDSRAVSFVNTSFLSTGVNLSTVYAGGASGFTYVPGVHMDGDFSIGIVFNMGDIAAGDSAVLAYSYVFNDSTGLDSVQYRLCGGPLVAGAAIPNTTSACSTTSVSFSLSGASTYAPTIYQWQSSADSVSWGNISGATGMTYAFTGVTATTYYRCKVTCKESGASVFTPGVKVNYLTVCPCAGLSAGTVMPTVTVACTTTSITLDDAGYTSSGTTLQWQSSPDGSTWTNITGATMVPYTFTGLTATTRYRLEVTCIASGITATSAGAIITYTVTCPCAGLTAGTVTPSVTTACPTTAIILDDVGYTSTGTTMQWQSSPDSATWTDIAGATLLPYTFTGLSASTYYRLVVTCLAAGTTATSPGVLITFTAGCPCIGLSAGTVSSTITTGCASTTFVLNDAGYTASGATYQWQSSTDSASWADIAGATSVPYTFSGLTTTTFYRLVVTCVSSGVSVSSAGLALTFAPCPCVGMSAGVAMSNVTTACPTTVIVLSDAGFTTSGVTYQWQSSADSASWSDVTGATTIPYTFTGLSATTWYRLVVICTATGVTEVSAGVKINFTTICTCIPLSAGVVSSNVPIACPTTYVILGDVGYTTTGVTRQWQASFDSVTWTDIPVTAVPYTFTGLVATTYYRLKVTCIVSGAVEVSAGKKIIFTPLCGGPTEVGGGVSAIPVSIYPNPAREVLQIETDRTDITQFSIANAVGQVMMQQKTSGKQTLIDIKALPSGVYYITLQSELGNEVRKFVKL